MDSQYVPDILESVYQSLVCELLHSRCNRATDQWLVSLVSATIDWICTHEESLTELIFRRDFTAVVHCFAHMQSLCRSIDNLPLLFQSKLTEASRAVWDIDTAEQQVVSLRVDVIDGWRVTVEKKYAVTTAKWPVKTIDQDISTEWKGKRNARRRLVFLSKFSSVSPFDYRAKFHRNIAFQTERLASTHNRQGQRDSPGRWLCFWIPKGLARERQCDCSVICDRELGSCDRLTSVRRVEKCSWTSVLCEMSSGTWFIADEFLRRTFRPLRSTSWSYSTFPR